MTPIRSTYNWLNSSGKQFPKINTITNADTKNGPKCTTWLFFFITLGSAITSPSRFAKKIVHNASHQFASASANASAKIQSPPPISRSFDAL